MNSNSLNALALQRLKKDFWGVFSFCAILVFGLLSLFAYIIAPDNSEHANQMHRNGLSMERYIHLLFLLWDSNLYLNIDLIIIK